jgi:Na+/proline symporter
MWGVAGIDWLVIIAYLAVVLALGLGTFRRVKSASGFFIGDRRYGKLTMILNSFGAGTHSDQAVTVSSKTFSVGISGIWYEWLWLFATPFFWVLAPIFRRMRAVTTGDYFQARYGRSVSVLYALVGALQLMMGIGIMLKSSGAMVTAVSGGQIDFRPAVLGMTAVFVIYNVVGGLHAAIITNLAQGFLTFVFSFLILPFAWQAVGGISGMRAALPDPSLFAVVAPRGITVFYVAVISLNALIGWVTQPNSMSMSAAGRTEMEGRVGVMCGTFLKRICTVAWALTALCAMAYFLGRSIHPDQAFGLMARELLPKAGPGLVGLFIATMFASVMSSCNVQMLSSAGLLTQNIYRPLVAPGRPERHYIAFGRIAGTVIVAFGLLFASQFSTVVQAMETWWKVTAMMGIPFILGLFWRRMTAAAAWASTLAAFAALLLTGKISLFGHTIWDFNAAIAPRLPEFLLFDGKLYLPWQMIIYLTAGLVAAVAVSLLTPRAPEDRLNTFYECLRTPIAPGEPETRPFTLPPGTTPAPRNVLFKHPDFEVPKPTLVGIAGFLAGWAFVGLLIFTVYLIMKG